jgi:1,4-dihydroxy-2-naphthoyl-CoA hydrolase
VRADLCTLGDVAHGGALMAMADTVGAIATILTPSSGLKATTKARRISSEWPASDRHWLRSQRRYIVVDELKWQTRMETDQGRLVATVMQMQLVL